MLSTFSLCFDKEIMGRTIWNGQKKADTKAEIEMVCHYLNGSASVVVNVK